jgi:fucose permease
MNFLAIARERLLLLLAFSCFILLGISNGLLGVAWPSVRQTFGVPLDALAWLLIASTSGFIVASVLAGQLTARLGIVPSLLIGNVFAAAGLIGYATAPGWWIMVLVGFLSGWGAGAIDTGLNIYVAANHSVRTMNWMHASFGVGATIGPLIMTTFLSFGLGWRYGYAFAGVLHLLLALIYLIAWRSPEVSRQAAVRSERHEAMLKPVRSAKTLRLPLVWLSIVLFFLYTGVEVTAGQWSFSMYTESRDVSTPAAGILTSIYWGALTLGRFALGAVVQRAGVERSLRLSMVGVIVAAVLFTFRVNWVSFAGLALMGFSLAIIFPTLTSDSPHRVGVYHAANTIGFQTGAASFGLAIMPGLAGILASVYGLEIIGPYLIAGALAMWAVNEIILYVMRKPALARSHS